MDLESAGCGDLVDAVLQMVRFPYAKHEQQKQGRPRATQVLMLLDGGERREKRVRRDLT